MTTTASTAPVTAEPAAAEEYQNPNDLSTELSAEDEQAFVNDTLGIGQQNEPEAEPTGAVEDEKPTGEPAPVAPVAAVKPEEPKVPEAQAPEEQKVEPKPVELEEVKVDDLWVTVDKVTVDEAGVATTEKIKLVFDPENPSSFLPDDFQFKDDKQLADILEAKAEMAALYKERNEKYLAAVEAGEAEDAAEQDRAATLAGWDQEISDLIESGIIAAPKVKVGEPGFLEDASVKRIDEVFKFMVAQNEQRAKDGKQEIKSFGTAFSLYANDEQVKAAAAAKAQDNADAKAKGALVGGSSAASTGGERAYIAGSASNIWEVPVE